MRRDHFLRQRKYACNKLCSLKVGWNSLKFSDIILIIFFLLSFLFVSGLYHPTRDFFYSYGDVTITSEWLQYLTFARRSWSFSSKGSLACHTYWDTWHPFIMVISENPWHELSLPVFTTYVYRWESNTQPSACGANILTHCATAAFLSRRCGTSIIYGLITMLPVMSLTLAYLLSISFIAVILTRYSVSLFLCTESADRKGFYDVTVRRDVFY